MNDEKAGIEDMIPTAIVVTVLVVLFSVIPIIGYNVDIAVPIPFGSAALNGTSAAYTATANAWSANNTAITNASELWSTNSPLLSLAVLVGIIFAAIGMLITGGNKINSGGGGL